MIIGYTAGVFDMFHIGHLNLLRNAKSMCDKLIVGISVDSCIAHKNKTPVMPFHERMAIVQACKYVDAVIPQTDLDKYKAWEHLNYDILFSGDDWKGVPRWIEYEQKLNMVGVKVVYFPYTKGTSSTLLLQALKDIPLME